MVRDALPPSASFLDLHDLLPETAFFHADLATEHMAEAGRVVLTARIVPLIAGAGG